MILLETKTNTKYDTLRVSGYSFDLENSNIQHLYLAEMG